MVSPCVQAYEEATQDQLRRDDVDLVDERRWQAALRNTRYRQVLGATTSDLCIVGSSRWMIWCSGAYFPVKACTSSPPAGRILSG
jgi:hypothetical protein